MTQPLVTVRSDTSPAEVAKTMVECRDGCVPVVDGHGRP
jgi:CBS domain-containing protein